MRLFITLTKDMCMNISGWLLIASSLLLHVCHAIQCSPSIEMLNNNYVNVRYEAFYNLYKINRQTLICLQICTKVSNK